MDWQHIKDSIDSANKKTIHDRKKPVKRDRSIISACIKKNVSCRNGMRRRLEIKSGKFLTVERVPVVEVVEVDGIENRAVIRATNGAEDASARITCMDVSGDGGIEGGD